MGVLLNDEELLDASNVAMFTIDGDINYAQGYLTSRQQVAKAQLKKVVNIHRGIIETNDSVEIKLLKVQEFWVDLLKEIE